jgi:hypothetical protein
LAGHLVSRTACPACDDDDFTLQRKVDSSSAKDEAISGDPVALLGAGLPLDREVRAFFEPKFGRDLSDVRVHADGRADAATRAVAALAFTTGRHVAFRSGRYGPQTPSGRKLLAHELTHVVQQQGRGTPALQRQYSASAAPKTDPNAYIPVADLIGYVEDVERAYPGDGPEEVLARIRTQYYSGLAFDQLIPDAKTVEIVKRPHMVPTRGGGMVVDTPVAQPRRLNSKVGPAAWSHLTAHADENAVGDNPSPYIVMPDGSRIDLGHLLLGLDALLHPATGVPFSTFGIANIDPASWVADLALASYWTDYHATNGKPDSDAPIKPASADFDAYYRASAPDEDLLGDADAFGTHEQSKSVPGQALSQVLRAYYLGAAGAAPGVQHRWRTFCGRNSLGFTTAGGSITWNPGLDAVWVPRIDRMADLSEAGASGAIWQVLTPGAPARKTRTYSAMAFQRFLAWLKPRLEAEMAAHP